MNLCTRMPYTYLSICANTCTVCNECMYACVQGVVVFFVGDQITEPDMQVGHLILLVLVLILLNYIIVAITWFFVS